MYPSWVITRSTRTADDGIKFYFNENSITNKNFSYRPFIFMNYTNGFFGCMWCEYNYAHNFIKCFRALFVIGATGSAEDGEPKEFFGRIPRKKAAAPRSTRSWRTKRGRLSKHISLPNNARRVILHAVYIHSHIYFPFSFFPPSLLYGVWTRCLSLRSFIRSFLTLLVFIISFFLKKKGRSIVIRC